jgi:hypothetical protein
MRKLHVSHLRFTVQRAKTLCLHRVRLLPENNNPTIRTYSLARRSGPTESCRQARAASYAAFWAYKTVVNCMPAAHTHHFSHILLVLLSSELFERILSKKTNLGVSRMHRCLNLLSCTRDAYNACVIQFTTVDCRTGFSIISDNRSTAVTNGSIQRSCSRFSSSAPSTPSSTAISSVYCHHNQCPHTTVSINSH